MGRGIAQLLATAGYRVNLTDAYREVLDAGLRSIREGLGRLAERGRIKESVDAIYGRISPQASIGEAVDGCDLVIEAATENPEVKRAIFEEMDARAPPHAILASNTSGLPITFMADATSGGRRRMVAGLHFFNPPTAMRLVEVVKGRYTDDETVEALSSLSRFLGKEPIVVRRDIRGFIANRVNRAIRYEAFAMVLRGEAEPVAIDSAMRYGLGAPMGPFELVDFTGIDLELGEEGLFNYMRERYPEWEPHDEYVAMRSFALRLARDYADRGWLGVKSGRGFYTYPAPGKWVKVDLPREAGESLHPMEIVAPAVNLSAWLLERGVADARDVEAAMELGFNYPKGLLKLADEYGLDLVVEELQRKERKSQGAAYAAFYQPVDLLARLARNGGRLSEVELRAG